MKTIKKYEHAGQPTKYIPEIIDPKIEEYLLNCGRKQTSLPTIEGLALYLGVDDTTIVNWTKKHKEFFATIKKMMMKQKVQLIDDGMYGGKDVNAGMAIFLLKVNHHMLENDPHTLVQVNVSPLLGGRAKKSVQDGSNGNK